MLKMGARVKNLDALIDREEIRDCVVRLARGEDRRDGELIKTCYWPDAMNDYGVFVGDFDQYFAWVVPGDPNILLTQHALGQTYIEIDGDKASAETHVASYHRLNVAGAHQDSVIGGRYLDRLEKRGGEWRIAYRTLVYDWERAFGASADWSKGVMGIAFISDNPTGKCAGDKSEGFFKGK
jgi:hypothetical protein